jgi:hypothetical protein
VSLEVRRADAEDAPSILNCLAVAFEMYRCQYSPQVYADTVLDSDTVRRRMAEMSVLVAVSEGQVVGTIAYCVRRNEGHVRGMAVLPRWRGRCICAAGNGGGRIAGARLRACNTEQYSTIAASDSVLRTEWIFSVGSSHGILRHATVRIRKIPLPSMNGSGATADIR